MAVVSTAQPPPRCWLVRLYRAAPSRCVCWLCVCRVSACRLVGVCVGVLGGKSLLSQYPVFFRKSNYIQRTTTTHKLHFHVVWWIFCWGVLVVFFVFFSGYDARACPAWPSNPPRLRRRTPPARAEIVEPAWPAWSARAVFIEPAWPARLARFY